MTSPRRQILPRKALAKVNVIESDAVEDVIIEGTAMLYAVKNSALDNASGYSQVRVGVRVSTVRCWSFIEDGGSY